MGTFLSDIVSNIKAAVSGGGSSGGSSGGGQSAGNGGQSFGGLQLGAGFDFKGKAGSDFKGKAGSGKATTDESNPSKVRARIGGELVSSGLKKMEQANKMQSLVDTAKQTRGLMLGQWGDSREGAALTNRELTGDRGEDSAVEDEENIFSKTAQPKETTTGKVDSTVRPTAAALRPTAAALTPEQRQERKEEVRQQNAQLEQDYRELNSKILYGRIGRDYTEEDIERLNNLETQIQDNRDELKALQADVRYGPVLGLNTMTGFERAGLGVTKMLDWLVGEGSIPWGLATETATLFGTDLEGKNPVSALKRQGEQEVQGWASRATAAAEGNDVAEMIGQHTQSISESLPFVVLNLMSMGTAGMATAAGQTAGLQYTAALNSSPGMKAIGEMSRYGLKQLAKDPGAQYSFISSFGENYEDAIESGASEIEATLYAAVNSSYNAMIEVGGSDEGLGGMQMLPKEVREAIQTGKSGIVMDWVKSVGQEIGEEELQGIMERGLKQIYTDVPTFSTTDENAIFNPQVMKDTAINTAIDTAIMGGVQTGINTAALRAEQNRAKRAEREGIAKSTNDAARAEEAARAAAAYQEEQSALLLAAQEHEAEAARARAAGAYQEEQDQLRLAGQARAEAEAKARAADAYQEEQNALLEAVQAREQAEELQKQAQAYQEEQDTLRLAQQERQAAEERQRAAQAYQEEQDTLRLAQQETERRNGDVEEDEQVTAQTQPGLLEQEEAQQGEGEAALRVGTADELRAGTAAGTETAIRLAGEDLPDGSGRWDAGQRAGGEAGQLDRDAGTGSSITGTGGSGRARTGESYGDALRKSGARQLSSREFGLERGTDTPTFYEITEDLLTDDLKQLRYGIGTSTGCSVEFVSGPMQVVGRNGRVQNIGGFYDPANRRIVVRADSRRYTAEQIARHEEFHALADLDPHLVDEIRDRITERFGRKEMERIVRGYQIARRGINDITSGVDAEAREAQELLEEIFADANGNMNAFGLGANRFAFNTWTTITNRENRRSQTANGTKTTRGPPRYTYAGEQARTANMETLQQAKELEEADVDNETIRQQTGWFRGMDGKWRFEISDGDAEYSRAGDVEFRKDHPEYAEFRNLLGRFGELSEEEMSRLRELHETWNDEIGRLKRRLENGSVPLNQVLDHPALYRAYPELKETRVQIRETDGGVEGGYNPADNTITISKNARDNLSTLLHEAQHAIQEIEGFTRGASTEYWMDRNAREQPELDARMEELRESARSIREELDGQRAQTGYDEFVDQTYALADQGSITEEEAERRIQQFEEEHAGLRSLEKALDAVFREMQDIRGQMRTAADLYRSTAGEIEARDVQDRLQLGEAERRATAPNLGDENTVFAEGSGTSYDIKYPKYTDEEMKNNSLRLQHMDVVKNLSGDEFSDHSKSLRENVLEYFDSLGNNVQSEEFGDVALTASSVRSDIRHGNTREKITAYAAIPEVIQSGTVIYRIDKGFGLERIVTAAPIRIGEQKYFMAVMLQRDPRSQRLYAHDVVIAEEPVSSAGRHLSTNRAVRNEDKLFITDILQNALSVKQSFSIDEDEDRSGWNEDFRKRVEDTEELIDDLQEFYQSVDEYDENRLSQEELENYTDYNRYSRNVSMYGGSEITDSLNELAKDATGERRTEIFELMERMLPHLDELEQQRYTGDRNDPEWQPTAFSRWYNKRHPSLYYPGYQPGDLFDRGKADSWTAWDNQDREKEYLQGLIDSGKLMEPELSQARNMLERLENPEERDIFYSMDEDQIREEYEQLDEEREELGAFFDGLDFIDGKYIRTDSGRTVTEQDVQEKAARLEEVENRQRELREVLPEESEEETEEEPPFDMEDDFYEERRSAGELSLGETEREEARQEEQTEDREEQGLRLGAQEETEEREEAEGQMELPEDPKDRTIRDLITANRELERTANYWKKQGRITGEGEETAKRSDVKRVADELAEHAAFQGDRAELREKLQKLADTIVSNNRGEGLSWEDIREQAREIASLLVDNSNTVIDTEADTRKAILTDLKEMKIRPDKMWTQDFGDWNAMRQRLVGKIIFNAKEGRSIDDVYQQLRGSYGEGLFPESITAGSDQLNRIIDVLDQLRPSMNYNFASDQDAELAEDYYTNRITDELLFGNVGEELTKADRNYRRVKERMRDAEQKLREVKKESRQKIEDLQKMQRHEVRAAVENQRKQVQEREEKQKLRKKISQTGKRLIKYLTENNGQKNPIPEPLKEAVGKVLLDLDISGGMDVKQKKRYVQDMQQVARIVTQQNAYMEGNTDKWAGMYLDLPADIQQELDEHLQNVQKAMDEAEAKGKVWNPNMMGTEELQRLDEILTVLTSAITNSNEILSDARGAKISEEAAEGIREIDSLGTDRKRSERGESLNKFLRFQNTTPYYFFKRLGKAGMRMFERIQDGWDKFALNARQVVDFANETYTEQEAREIQETVYEFQLRRRGDMSEGFEKPETVRMTKAQIMSLYCLWKREQARGHLTGAGIRIADFRDGKSSVTQAENYLLDLEDIAKITGKLTERDREIADALQKYMNTVGSDWGNEVSMKRFGIRSFTEENYFPITTDDRTRPVRNPESDTANLYRLLNMSFTKSTQRGASNSVVIDNIFDVFANHMADMAKYNGLGLPMLDAMKWVSYNQTSELNESGQYGYESVQKSMERAFGKEARTYFTTFMKDLNGVREGGRGEEFGSRMLSSYKVAAVGANLRVALLQPTSYLRASAVIDGKYLVKGLGMSNKQGQEEARKWSGTAVWKDLGFYDTNINAGLREMIKHTDGLKGKIQEASMKGAELGDKMTWGALWNACKAEQTDRGFTGDELMQKTAERFREVVYRTQVMDSTMTRSHVMRQKGAYAGMVTAFMSEPTLSYNMLLDAYTEYENEVRKEAKGSTDKATLKKAREKAWEKAGPAVGKAATAYLATATLSAIVESVIDAARDDDEYANFLERFAEKLLGFNVKDPDSTTWEKIKGITSGNLMQDLLVHNKLPVVKDFFSILSGNDTSRMDTEWMNNIIRAGQIAWESLALRAGWIDEPTKITYNGNMTAWGKIYNMLRGVSQVTGLPLGNAMRDLSAMWNSTVGEITGKKIQTYDPGPLKQIQYALKDGYITEDDAVKLLMEKELVDDEIEARQQAYVWANPEKYENMLAAMRAGDKEGFEAAKDQLEDLRYKQSSIMAAVTSEVKEMYLRTDGTEPISREEAMSLMMEYGGMIERKAETEIQKWTCELETGIPYDGIDEAYIAGDITREQAEKMLVEYGGYAEDKAAAQVQKWTSQVDEGIWYSEIDDYYFYGDITYKEAVDMYMKYGGMDRETAENTVLETKFLKDFGRERDRIELQDMYVSGEYDRDKMKEIMLEYGYSANENSAENSLIRWDFIGDDMSLDEVTPTQAKAYFNGIEDAEIDKHTYLDFATRAADIKADYDENGKSIMYSKMDKVLALIDSLDLSDEQKDALALIYGANGKGYAEKNLSRAPWHEGSTKKSTKKSGGRSGGGGGGRKKSRRSGGGGGGGLSLPAVEAVDSGRGSYFDDILDQWRKRKLTRAEILKLLKEGKLTQKEADQILATLQEGDEAVDSTDRELLGSGLQLGAAEDADLLKEP